MKLTLHKCLLPLTAGILFTLCSPSRAQYIFSENFNDYTNGTQGGVQIDDGLLIYYGGTLAGWNKSGGGAVHAVNLDGVSDYAPMIWQDNVLTASSGIPANALGTAYGVAFLAGPAAWNGPSQSTAAGDGLVIGVLRGDNSVLFTYTCLPGAWAGAETLAPYSFQYVGDGSGPVRLQIRALLQSGHFGGAIDNLTVTNLGPAPPPAIITQPVGAALVAGDYFTFSVVATNALTYQWLLNTTAISGATNASYVIPDVRTNDAGTYSVRVGNPAGSVLSGDAVLSVTPAPTFANYQAAVLAAGPVHYYRLNETSGTVAADLGSQAATGGTYMGGCTLGLPSVTSEEGTCVQFDSQSGTFVNLGLFHVGDSVTVEAFANLTQTRGSSYYEIVARMGPPYGLGSGSYTLEVGPGNVPDFAAINDSGALYHAYAASSVAPGSWHHLVGVFDAVGGTTTIYLDGVRGQALPITGVLQDAGPTPDSVLIGANNDGINSGYNWGGLLDEVAIYTNALSAVQVRQHYHASISAPPSLTSQPAVIVSWPAYTSGHYALQSATNVTGPYSNYTGAIFAEGTNSMAPVPLGPTNMFLRLLSPR